jgi:serine/threonine-protein kinase
VVERPGSAARPEPGEYPSRPVQLASPAVNEAVPQGRSPSQPVRAASRPVQVQPEPHRPAQAEENPLDIDWITWALGLLAFLAIGGLIPFWLWIYFLYNPPVR